MLLAVKVDGIILPMNVHRFLFDGGGVSVVILRRGLLVVSGFDGERNELRLVLGEVGDAIMPSKFTNELVGS